MIFALLLLLIGITIFCHVYIFKCLQIVYDELLDLEKDIRHLNKKGKK